MRRRAAPLWRLLKSASPRVWLLAIAAAGPASICANAVTTADEPRAIEIPTGQAITPTAAKGAIFNDLNPGLEAIPDQRAGQAVAVAVSPDGQMLAILSSGYNLYFSSDGQRAPELSTEHVFLFDISGRTPKQFQTLAVPNTFQGLAWAPSSQKFFVSGGEDDTVVELVRSGSGFATGRTFQLGHKAGLGLETRPMVGGLAVSADGTRLLVANLQNDSVSLIDLKSGQVVAEQDLRPGIIDRRQWGQSGGSYPRSVAWTSTDRAYVASERDREILSLKISGARMRIVHRIPVPGQPVAVLANRDGTRLYAALSTTGEVAIIDTHRDTMIEAVDATAPASLYVNTMKLGGVSSNALALTPRGDRLLVSNGGENAVAVIRLSPRARGLAPDDGRGYKDKDGDDDDDHPSGDAERSSVVGLVPTGWYPYGIATAKDGAAWYIVNGKNESGANASECGENVPQCLAKRKIERPANATANGAYLLRAQNRWIFQLQKAGFLTMPAPGALELARLTRRVARNNHFDKPDMADADARLFEFLRKHIQHVIYIIKENRSYDQVLGDLQIGNGDPHLTLFPEAISPNHHALARNFVTADHFMVSGEVSWSGWDWAVSAQTNDFREHQEPLASAHRGLDGEATGFNRNINMGYPTSKERHAAHAAYPSDPDILPSERDVTAPDGPGGEEGTGHLWDVALHRGLTLRNWGFFGENLAYNASQASLIREPYLHQQRVFVATKSALASYSDPYYLDFAPNFPDFWRVKEFKREFSQFSNQNTAPQLMLIRLGNDHFGAFDKAIDGVNTPETQMADNDYALGLIVQAVADSPFAQNTLIVSIEDDACDGPDHVDAHRSIALFAGPYVRQHALVSTRYTTVSVVKTIEEILGIGPIGLNDALAAPMSDIFDPSVKTWSYQSIVPDVLRSTQLPLPPATHASNVVPRHSAAYWAKVMAGQDFSDADRVDPVSFNRALWRGLKGDAPYPPPPRGT